MSDNQIWDPDLLSQAHYSFYYTLMVLELFIRTTGKLMALRESGMIPLFLERSHAFWVPLETLFKDRVSPFCPLSSFCPTPQRHATGRLRLHGEKLSKPSREQDRTLAQLRTHIADMEAKYEDILHVSTTL